MCCCCVRHGVLYGVQHANSGGAVERQHRLQAAPRLLAPKCNAFTKPLHSWRIPVVCTLYFGYKWRRLLAHLCAVSVKNEARGASKSANSPCGHQMAHPHHVPEQAARQIRSMNDLHFFCREDTIQLGLVQQPYGLGAQWEAGQNPLQAVTEDLVHPLPQRECFLAASRAYFVFGPVVVALRHGVVQRRRRASASLAQESSSCAEQGLHKTHRGRALDQTVQNGQNDELLQYRVFTIGLCGTVGRAKRAVLHVTPAPIQPVASHQTPATHATHGVNEPG